jgi:hypothetical protein
MQHDNISLMPWDQLVYYEDGMHQGHFLIHVYITGKDDCVLKWKEKKAIFYQHVGVWVVSSLFLLLAIRLTYE